jgi:hypothetical protein
VSSRFPEITQYRMSPAAKKETKKTLKFFLKLPMRKMRDIKGTLNHHSFACLLRTVKSLSSEVTLDSDINDIPVVNFLLSLEDE